MVRAKFKCESKTEIADGFQVGLRAVTEDQDWSKYTPAGQLLMAITNEAASAQFEEGKVYYIDISPAEG